MWCASALLLVFNSCSSEEGIGADAASGLEGATFVGDKACADCHGSITRVFPASCTARPPCVWQESKMPGQTGCESCHGPASKHVATGSIGPKFIVNPGKDPAACFQCHLSTEAEFHLPQHHPVVEGKMNCVQCHDPHGMDIMKPAGGLSGAWRGKMNPCAQCHREQTKARRL